MSSVKHFPYDVIPFTEEEHRVIKKIRTSEIQRFVHLGPKGYVLPEHFLTHAEGILKLRLRPDDVSVISYPRSGTTWTQELVWLIANNLDFDKANSTPLQERYKFLEYYMFHEPAQGEKFKNDPVMRKVFEQNATPVAETLNDIPGQRFIKTHLPLSMLPTHFVDTSKVIYVARNMKDVAVSCYYFAKANKFLGVVCDFKTFYEDLFAKNLSNWSPYFEHIKEAWALRNHPNMLFLFYEELSKDLQSVARRVADFLGKEYTDEQFDKLCDHLNFDNFKKNAAVDSTDLKQLNMLTDGDYIRKGKSGGWRDHFDEEMLQHAEEWTNKELQGTGFSFP